VNVDHLVIGAGEVGRAVAEVLQRGPGTVAIRDVVPGDDDPGHARMLHICFPHGDGFEDQVIVYRAIYVPDVVVIHSTVPVGTTRYLGEVHSPVRGMHPNLVEGLLTFVKFFAGAGAEDAAAAFKECGVPVEVAVQPETTEAGKLWELLQYGLAIVIQKEIYAWCEAVGADPEVAYRRFAETYNEGYRLLGNHRVVRPVIRPMPGSIGGHCVVAGARLLEHPLADLLATLNEEHA
jgi:hypothetical protein